MRGIFMKVHYPTTTSGYEDYVCINHVPGYFTFYELDGSSYSKVTKQVDVGMSGDSTTEKMSAVDYLAYINDSSLWTKVGALYSITTAPDSSMSGLALYNLIPGLYIFNPHTFSVQVEYMEFL
jgi:hypothetical protein